MPTKNPEQHRSGGIKNAAVGYAIISFWSAILGVVLAQTALASHILQNSSHFQTVGVPDSPRNEVSKTTRKPPYLRRVDSPTLFPFMASRYVQAKEAIVGYKRSGVPLIALQEDKWLPAAGGDEPGFAYFIPKILASHTLTWTDP